MKQFVLCAQTGIDALELVERPQPLPGVGKVVVRVTAASLNYRDLMVADGRYGKVALPMVPLSDGAGTVVSLGEGVTQWAIGDRVAGTFFQAWEDGPFRRSVLQSALGGAINGMLAEFVELSASGIVAIPAHLSDEEASTLPCAALTAWQALVSQGEVSAGQTVLLLGTGGVSLAALQFAKMHGARVILTSSSEEKMERARDLGADETINYRTTPDWEKAVYRLTAKEGVDHVVEVGGSETFLKSLRSLAPSGRISLIGGVTGFSTEVPLMEIIGKSALVKGIYVGNRAMFQAMNRAMAVNQTRPVIDRVFPFEHAAAAYRYQASSGHFGKVVLAGW